MKVLAVGAHPDDLEISCAGTLTKMVQAGHEVVLCHASDGDKGHYEIPPGQLTAMRRKEAERAGAIIGCEVISLGLRDGEVQSVNEDTRMLFLNLFRTVRPDVVITHAANDYMPDHREVHQLVFDMTFMATLPGFASQEPVLEKIPALFYMDNLAGLNFTPSIYVDITKQMDTKLNMLRQHHTQVKWLSEHDHIDIVDFVTTHNKMRGFQGGCQYAEGFVHDYVWGRPNAVSFPV